MSAVLKSAVSTSCVETVLYTLTALRSDRGRQFYSHQLNLFSYSSSLSPFSNSATTIVLLMCLNIKFAACFLQVRSRSRLLRPNLKMEVDLLRLAYL